jgi:APA family basic amino acid/polyamine antiporter
MGLGSILGTGIFVSIGIGAGLAGSYVILAVAIAAIVAAFNGLSSAELAASHPVSGGTYEYGYRYLNPALGFVAGWMFLSAKSASAATAALGFAGYLLDGLGHTSTVARISVAAVATVLLTLVAASGMRRSNRANAVIVSVTLLALGLFVIALLPKAIEGPALRLTATPISDSGGHHSLLHATALMFVAYTGYGRVATLGEEIRNPSKNIPRAIIATLVITMTVYVTVAFVAVGTVGASQLAMATSQTAAPLEFVAKAAGAPTVAWLVALGAITAMLGVLLNLVLGLSRVVLAMARRGDLPASFAELTSDSPSPRRAVLLVGGLITGLCAIGSVQTTWSFSAFTVLVYYALTNLAALRLPPELRLYPRAVPLAGLLASAGLAFWVEPRIWISGLGLIVVGLLWHVWRRRLRRPN